RSATQLVFLGPKPWVETHGYPHRLAPRGSVGRSPRAHSPKTCEKKPQRLSVNPNPHLQLSQDTCPGKAAPAPSWSSAPHSRHFPSGVRADAQFSTGGLSG